MKFMNEWEIQRAFVLHLQHPVLGKATRILRDLKDLVNECSDGWCYWTVPVRAAKRLMELIESPQMATEEGLKAALVPIKSMLTRYKVAFGDRTITF